MKSQKQIRIDNLSLFSSCFTEFCGFSVRFMTEIDGEKYVTVEYDPNFFDEERYQENRNRG